MTLRTWLLVLVALALLPAVASSNPLPLTHVSPLEDAVAEVIDSEGRTGGQAFAILLGRYGFSLSDETLHRVRTHMSVLEPFILDSQREVDRLDGRLHDAFARWASPAARDSMCAILRMRLPQPDSDDTHRIPTSWTGPDLRDLVVCAEILSDYEDTKATDGISAARQMISNLDQERLDAFYASESPGWFMDMALRRIQNSDSAAILMPRDPDLGFFRLCREAADIVDLSVTAESGPEATWHQVSPDPPRDRRILAHLASSRSATRPVGGMYPNHRWACLKLVFRDGSKATIDLTTLGVHYTDNTRYSATGHWLQCDELVKDIWELVGQFEDMVEL